MSIENREFNFLNRCSLFVVIIGVILILTSGAVLIGWQYNLPTLTNILSSWPSMKINTAICFFLSGWALILLDTPQKFITYAIVVMLSIGILMISIATIIQFVFGIDLGVDQLFNKEIFLNPKTQYFDRMPLITAFNFMFIGFAFLFTKLKAVSINQLIAWSVFFLGLLSFYNFIYNANMQYVFAAHTTMALTTSILFMLLSLGILLIKPNVFIIQLLMSDHIGSYYFRRTLPFILFVPMILAIIALKMQTLGVVEGNLGNSIIAAGTFLILGFITSIIVLKMNREEKKLVLAQTEIKENEKIFNEFTNNVDIIFYRMSPDLKTVLYISPAYEKIWGKSIQSLYENRQDWLESIFPEDQKIVYETFLDELRHNSSSSAEYRIKRPDGSTRNIFDRAFQLKDKNNNLFCFMGIAIDVTAVKTDQKYLQTQYDILRLMEHDKALSELAPKILKILCEVFDWDLGEIWLVDEGDNILRCVNIWHKETLKMINYEKESRNHSLQFNQGFPGRIWKEKDTIWLSDYANNKRESSPSVDVEKTDLNCAFGTPIIFQGKVFGIIEFFSYQIHERDEALIGLMNTTGKLLGEFIQRTHTNEEINAISRCDFLTGLLNRSTIEEELNDLISTKKSEPIAIIIADIDKFKLVNEALGHDTGDLILKKIAERLKQLTFHEKYKIARLGADKFILYYYEIKHIGDILGYAHQIERAIKESISIDNREFFLTVTIGIALYPEDGTDSSTLITNANLAMIHAKEQGGDKSVFFTKELPAIALDKLTMYDDLHQAIIKKQFLINYQPQIDLKTGKICGAEALVRWQHPVKGLIFPKDFIHCAEESGLIIALNEHIMRMVFQQIKADWQGPPISINISTQQFNEKYLLAEYLESLLNEFGVKSKDIELEITESMIMNGAHHNIAVLAALHQLGFKIVLDDFGTGFSSFSYLYRIPVDKVKIDTAFIHGLPDNQVNFEIVKSMIGMLHSLKKSVVAEGVETDAEIQFLKQEGCDIVQGYYYYKPMSTEDFLSLITTFNMKTSRE